jgi:hypothetical protein
VLDDEVRKAPKDAYLPEFMDRLHARGAMNAMGR